jgi:dihydrolipoamide dehydrogenase
MADRFDLIVLGGDDSGFSAALRASQLGMNVALVVPEEDRAIVSQALLRQTHFLFRSLDAFDACEEAQKTGFAVKNFEYDFKRIKAEARNTIVAEDREQAAQIQKNGIRLFVASATPKSDGAVALTKEGKPLSEIQSRHILYTPPARFDLASQTENRLIWGLREALGDGLPKSIIVIGGGFFGLSLALFYGAVGVETTLVETAPRLLPSEDADLSDFARRYAEKRAIHVFTAAEIEKTEPNGRSVTLTLQQGVKTSLCTAQRALIAPVKAASNLALNLRETRAVLADGVVKTSPWYVSDEPGFYATGCAIDPSCSANRAVKEALLCVERIAGIQGIAPLDRTFLPTCLDGPLPIARVGWTEAEAVRRGLPLRRGAGTDASGNAIAKLLFNEKTGAMIGGHLAGKGAALFISLLSLAQTLESTEQELLRAAWPDHPVAQALQAALRSAFVREK